MAATAFQGNPVNTNADLPAVGTAAPAFTLVKGDLTEVTLEELKGRKVVLNIFPSIDTPVCAMSVRRFNTEAGSLENAVVLCVSADLPFASARFCGAEGLESVITASCFRSEFGSDYGVLIADSALAGLLARAVIVLDEQGTVTYTELVSEITQEPDYDAALQALKA